MPNTPLAQQLQQLFIAHYGAFRPDDFISIAAELGFNLSPTPPSSPTLSYHNQQQGASYWAIAPGAADIAEGRVWVSTELAQTLP